MWVILVSNSSNFLSNASCCCFSRIVTFRNPKIENEGEFDIKQEDERNRVNLLRDGTRWKKKCGVAFKLGFHYLKIRVHKKLHIGVSLCLCHVYKCFWLFSTIANWTTPNYTSTFTTKLERRVNWDSCWSFFPNSNSKCLYCELGLHLASFFHV